MKSRYQDDSNRVSRIEHLSTNVAAPVVHRIIKSINALLYNKNFRFDGKTIRPERILKDNTNKKKLKFDLIPLLIPIE